MAGLIDQSDGAGPIMFGTTEPKPPVDPGDFHVNYGQSGNTTTISLEGPALSGHGTFDTSLQLTPSTQGLGNFSIGYHDGASTGSVFYNLENGSEGAHLGYDFGNGISFEMTVSTDHDGAITAGLHFSF